MLVPSYSSHGGLVWIIGGNNSSYYTCFCFIRAGGDDDFALKIESIIEGCNDVCVRSVTEERTCQLFDDQSSPQYGKRKKLPEAILSIQNPCQVSSLLNLWFLLVPVFIGALKNFSFQLILRLQHNYFNALSMPPERATFFFSFNIQTSELTSKKHGLKRNSILLELNSWLLVNILIEFQT